MGASLGLITMIITFLYIKEDNSKYEKPTKFSFDFIKYKSSMKLFIAIFFVYLTNGCVTPFFVKYCVNGLQLSEGNASLSLLLLTIVGAVFAYPIGVLSDKIERRKVLLLGTLIFGISLVMGIFVKTALGVYFVMSVVGVGFISIQVTSYSILAEIVPPERIGEFMGIFNFFVSASQFVANNIMGMALDKFGYGVFFPIPAITMFTAVIIIALSKFEKYDVSKGNIH